MNLPFEIKAFFIIFLSFTFLQYPVFSFEILKDTESEKTYSDPAFTEMSTSQPFELLPDFEGGDPRYLTPTQDENEVKNRPLVITGHKSQQRGWECEPYNLEEKLEESFHSDTPLSSTKKMQLYADTTQYFIEKCERKLTVDRYVSALIPLIDSRRIFYPLLKNKKILPIRIRLGGAHGNTEIRALLGLQDLYSKRPLVILRNGLQSNRNSEMASVYIMKLMDEAGYNIIALPSNTGRDFQETNMEFALGGIDEAIQTISIAKEIQNPNLWISRLISSVHVIGYSLGGQTALFTALLNGHQPLLASGKNVVDSTLAVCPVVDLKKSIDHLYQKNSIVGIVFFFNMIKQMRDLISKFPHLDIVGFNPDGKLSMKKLKETISKTVFPHYQKKFNTPGWLLPPLEGLKLETESDFWKVHNFNEWIPELKFPVMTIASRDDGVVKTKQNVGPLMKNYEQYAQENNIPLEDYKIRFLDLKSGSHCQLHSGYGWGVASSFIKSWISYHSQDFTKSQNKKIIHIPENLIPPFQLNASLVTQYKGSQWEAIPHQNYFRLHFFFSEYERSKQQRKNTSYKFKIPTSLLNFKKTDLPTTPLEAQILTRWLNANARIWGENTGIPFLGQSNERPHIIELLNQK